MKPMFAFVSTWFLDPHSRITNRESIQRARLLSAILLVLIILDSLIIGLVLRADPNDIIEPTVQGGLGLLGVFVVMYVLNKAGYANLAAIGLILPFTGVFIYIPFFSGESPIFLVFILIPVILIALFFSLRWTMVASFVLLAGLYLLIDQQDHSPQNLVYWNMRNLWYFLTLATGLMLTFKWHGNTLEIIRQQDLKQINAELQESEARLRAVVENTPSFIVEVNRQGDILFINRQSKLYLGKNVREVLASEQIDDALVVIEKAFNSGEPQAIELQTLATTGQALWNSVRVGPVKQGELVTSLTIILTDITAQKEVQERIRQLNAELEQRVAERTDELHLANDALARAARMKDEFLASMSHELRTPLTGILAFAQTLQKAQVYGELNQKQLKAVHAIEDSGKHLLDLINDILDLAKVESGKLELELKDLAVEEVAQASLRLVKQMAVTKRQSVSYSLNPLDLHLLADARRLKQMLVNLLSNAIKFTPEGGALGLEIGGDVAQQIVRLSVWDKGVGIAPENFPRLFQSFVQIDGGLTRQQGGTGLGLALVRSMSELHGGSVSVESEVGQGSRFTISLPWSVPAAVTPHRTAPAAFVLPLNTPWPQQALTVEDSPVAAERLTDTLKELGIHNIVYPRGGGVVEQAVELQPGVVFLDVFLPEASGWQVLTQLKADERTRAIPVIIVSVLDDRARALQLGADDYLVKPVGRADLSGALERAKRRLTQPAAPPVFVVASSTRPSLLLAEDNEVNIQVLSDYLEASGYALTVARNGHEAVQSAQAGSPRLIIMDIQMPGMDGLEATRRIRQDPTLGRVPIIALTALAMPGDRERCLAAGANEYLTKPVNLEHLTEKIQILLKA